MQHKRLRLLLPILPMIWNNYEPVVKTVIAFLKLLEVKVNNATVDETLQSHPDWPSLLCISDSLIKWHVPNAAGRIDKKDIEQLPVPFIAYSSFGKIQLSIITKVDNGFVTSFTEKTNRGKESGTVSKEDFLKIWDGVYLIAEPTKESGEKDFVANKKAGYVKQLIPSLFFLAVISFLAWSLHQSVVIFQLNELIIYSQFAILLIGVIVTSLLLWYEVDKNNAALKKVCAGIAKGNCDAILSSKQSKLFSWLSWSEVGFFYFAGSLLSLVFAGNNLPGSIVLLSWLSLLALPYTVFSIYYQWRIAKQWCILCLAVQLLLVLGAAHALVFYNLQTPIANPASLYLLFIFLLTPLAWYTIKTSLQNLQKAKTKERQHQRLKFDTEIFDTLLKKQKKITHSADGLGIGLGNMEATYEIIKVCNPYCGPCSKAHPEIEKILDQNKNVKARIIFTARNDENDNSVFPAKHLLAIAGKQNEKQTKRALDDWYMADKKDYQIFAAKYPMNGELKQQGEKIEMMDKWCRATEIRYTPTFFVNGYKLPNEYSIRDLAYFLAE